MTNIIDPPEAAASVPHPPLRNALMHAVRQFAAALGLDEVITSPNRRTYNTTITEATAYIEGIPVHAWTQTEDPPVNAAEDAPAPADMLASRPAAPVVQSLAQAAGTAQVPA